MYHKKHEKDQKRGLTREGGCGKITLALATGGKPPVGFKCRAVLENDTGKEREKTVNS